MIVLWHLKCSALPKRYPGIVEIPGYFLAYGVKWHLKIAVLFLAPELDPLIDPLQVRNVLFHALSAVLFHLLADVAVHIQDKGGGGVA